MQLINAFILTSIAGLSTLLGMVPIFFNIKKDNINKFITLCLSFSLTIMIGISITDLFPESFFYLFLNYSLLKTIFITLISFLLGVILVLLLHKIKFTNNTLLKLGILNMIALILHNFPEGIATFLSSMTNINLGVKLSLAIMIHNIPEGICIAVPIYYSTNIKKKAFIYTLIAALSEPLGALLTYLILYKFISSTLLSIVLLYVCGIMITLAIHEMLPEALKASENKFIYYGLLIGVVVIFLMFIAI